MDLPKETRAQGLHEEPHQGLQSRSPTQPTSRAHTSSPPSCAYNTTTPFYTLLTTLLPAGRNVARAARYEIRRYVFADRRPQYVFLLCYSRFLRDFNMCCTVVQMSQRVDALEASIQDIINGDAPTGTGSTPSIPPSPGVSVSTPIPRRTRSGLQ